MKADPVSGGYRQVQSERAAADPRWWPAFLAILVLIVTIVLARGAWVLEDGLQPPTAPVMDSPPANVYGSFEVPIASPIVFPPYPTFPARIEMVMIEPTPTATSVVPTKVPTQGPFLCPDNPNTLPNGETCLGPALPLPTPLPPPTCMSTPLPGVTCMVRESVIQ